MIPALPVVCLLGFLHIVAFLKKFAHRREIETEISCGFFLSKQAIQLLCTMRTMLIRKPIKEQPILQMMKSHLSNQ